MKKSRLLGAVCACICIVTISPAAWAATINIAPNGVATASSTFNSNTPDKAIDGDVDTHWGADSYPTQWMQIDLGGIFSIEEIRANVAQLPLVGTTVHDVYLDDIYFL